MTAFGLALSLWLVVAVFLEIAERTQLFKRPGKALARAKALPRAMWGMSVAHLGVGVMLLGITVSEAWTIEELRLMSPGDRAMVGEYEYEFLGVYPAAGPNYSAVRGQFRVRHDGEVLTVLEPEDRVYAQPPMNTTEAAIYPLVSGDLHVVIGEAAGGNRWSVRLYYKPLISALWLGCLLLVLGGVISLTDRRQRIGAPMGRKKQSVEAGS